jgi:YegS/Rv2252/BmrU family lipid kinase
MKRVLAILNPISGYSRSRELPFQLKRRFARENFDYLVHQTRYKGDGAETARKLAKFYDVVVVAGGDGTVQEVSDAMISSNIPLTIIPAGTENLLAKELRITNDLDQLIQTIKWGKPVTMDVAKSNDKHFLLLCGIGFDAEVLLQLNKYRRGNITHLTYFWPIWRTFWEHGFPRMTVEADGESIIEDESALVFVTNISRYACGLRIGHNAVFNDGLLDLCVYRCDHQFPLLAHAWRTVRRTHLTHPRVIYRQCKNIRVSSSQIIPYETDGDPAGFLPADFSVIPSAVKILTPH